MEEIDILILGAGWTATFLIPLLLSQSKSKSEPTSRKDTTTPLSFAATTTDGRPVANHPTIRFKFDPASPSFQSSVAALPRARHVLITFPLVGAGPSRTLVETYTATHLTSAASASASASSSAPSPFRFIQLGSTGIWQKPDDSASGVGATSSANPWMTRHSSYTTADKRAVAEDELLALGGCVLELSGLWGGARDPRHWVDRVATSKEAVRGKKSLHMIHGVDVARAIVAVVRVDDEKWDRVGRGQRWMLTDGFVYDWWALFAGWAELKSVGEGEGEGEEDGGSVDAKPTRQAQWVYELMVEEGVRALPRSMEQLARCYDAREFWATFGLAPLKGRI
ncbi:hypothetical protein B0T17DRAFT_501012 [Bombardia bombarda]|uniref:Uncharacterized protein n=1 Tax=Bombardia bombarda TaxID=252184 RepID=A0AA39WCF3_9PEZI|nr:hypothetical protein B0T17DRAFT_501012 [Bombardia bombarda]